MLLSVVQRFPNSKRGPLTRWWEGSAAAGFQLLSELATTTQVLFFTHHQLLVDLAVAKLGPNVHRVNLAR